MNTTKKINVNFSSLVGLKAELLRKQAEVNEIKLKNESIGGLPQMNKKKNKKNARNTEKDSKEFKEPDNVVAHKKSKLMLEAKARLYEKLRKSRNNNENFLVDFENRLDESDEELKDDTLDENYPIEPEENWIEYQDCFGRTRKCLREDLPHMEKKNELIKQEIMKENPDANKEEENKDQFPVQEKEPEIEIMRRKWEEQTRKLADKVDIHYQDVLFDEARAHGVGYYSFSQDAEERTKQQENLINLRKETERKQVEMKEIKELKERMETNRLKAARIRQRIRAGLPAEPTEEELAQMHISFTDNSHAEKTNSKLAESDTEKSNEDTTREAASTEKDGKACEKENDRDENKRMKDEDKIKAFGELLNKKTWHVMSQEEWVHKCRAQRVNEFRPVYNNFTSAGFYNGSPSIESTYKDSGNNNPKTHNPERSIKGSAAKSQNHENYNSANEIASNASYIGSCSQNDKNNLADSDTINKNTTRRELPRNAVESIELNHAISDAQPTGPCSLSHSPTNHSQDVCSNFGKYDAHGEHEEMDDFNIPLPEKENTSSVPNNNPNHIKKPGTSSQNINEDSIMAGLKYLREKFEETHNK